MVFCILLSGWSCWMNKSVDIWGKQQKHHNPLTTKSEKTRRGETTTIKGLTRQDCEQSVNASNSYPS